MSRQKRTFTWAVSVLGAIGLLLAACGGGGGGGGDSGESYPVDFDVDSNRDGVITDDAADDEFEDTWNKTHGAVFYCNLDDDYNSGTEDFLNPVKSGPDIDDVTVIIARQTTKLPKGGSARISSDPSSAGRFLLNRFKDGAWSRMTISTAGYDVPFEDLQAGDVMMGVEGNSRLSTAWSGMLTLTLTIRNSSAKIVGKDVIRLRQAPPILATNLWQPTQVQVVDINGGLTDNTALVNALSAATGAAGISLLQVPGAAYGGDRWIQDSHEPGVHLLPAAGAPRRSVVFNYQCYRNRPIDAWVKPGLLAPDQGVLLDFGTDNTSLNYGGNVEVIPPHNGRAWGRTMVGGGNGVKVGTTTSAADHMDAQNRAWFNANPIQGTHVEPTTEWLAVGHIDEYTMFIPAPNTPRGFVCLIASPTRAWNQLLAMNAGGGGGNVVFAGRTTFGWQTTVSAIVGNGALGTLNTQVQARIDEGRAAIKAGSDLTDADFIELPVLFDEVGGGWLAALNPGVVNCVCLPASSGTTHLVIPDPEGPDDAGGDIWQQDILAQINPLFTAGSPATITFADVFYSYHDLLGEAHCGTNTIRTAPAGIWWDK